MLIYVIESKISTQHGSLPCYSFTGPIAGEDASVDPGDAPAPNGANVTAYYHTHGAYDPQYNSEYFFNNFHSMLIYVIKAKTSTQHKLLPWNTKFNNIQIFRFRYVNYIRN
jgi:hypothetical protein